MNNNFIVEINKTAVALANTSHVETKFKDELIKLWKAYSRDIVKIRRLLGKNAEEELADSIKNEVGKVCRIVSEGLEDGKYGIETKDDLKKFIQLYFGEHDTDSWLESLEEYNAENTDLAKHGPIRRFFEEQVNEMVSKAEESETPEKTIFPKVNRIVTDLIDTVTEVITNSIPEEKRNSNDIKDIVKMMVGVDSTNVLSIKNGEFIVNDPFSLKKPGKGLSITLNPNKTLRKVLCRFVDNINDNEGKITPESLKKLQDYIKDWLEYISDKNNLEDLLEADLSHDDGRKGKKNLLSTSKINVNEIRHQDFEQSLESFKNTFDEEDETVLDKVFNKGKNKGPEEGMSRKEQQRLLEQHSEKGAPKLHNEEKLSEMFRFFISRLILLLDPKHIKKEFKNIVINPRSGITWSAKAKNLASFKTSSISIRVSSKNDDYYISNSPIIMKIAVATATGTGTGTGTGAGTGSGSSSAGATSSTSGSSPLGAGAKTKTKLEFEINILFRYVRPDKKLLFIPYKWRRKPFKMSFIGTFEAEEGRGYTLAIKKIVPPEILLGKYSGPAPGKLMFDTGMDHLARRVYKEYIFEMLEKIVMNLEEMEDQERDKNKDMTEVEKTNLKTSSIPIKIYYNLLPYKISIVQ